MFQEIQRFRQGWLWVIVIIIAAGVASPAYLPAFNKQPVPFYISVLLIIIPLLVMFLLFMMRLETEITEEGISFFYFPLIKKKLIPWSQIETVFVRKYHPVMEYGGWGIRYSTAKRGRALNTSGNIGIQIVFKDKKRLLLGTQKPEEAAAVIAAFAKRKVVKNVED
ncbi:hypothetical protein ACTHGU_01550 [Chitinophagaceae bacterium MMS25-I14]